MKFLLTVEIEVPTAFGVPVVPASDLVACLQATCYDLSDPDTFGLWPGVKANPDSVTVAVSEAGNPLLPYQGI